MDCNCSGSKAAVLGVCLMVAALAGCKASGVAANDPSKKPPSNGSITNVLPQLAAEDAPAPEKTGGFDGKKAFAHVAKQVSFGPRPAGSAALAQTQQYIVAELKSYGCVVEADDFSADTPAGRLPMKNILAKIPGEKPGIILLGTHYDTKRLDNFVGADDGGSSTGVMLEMARLLCQQHGRYAVWIAFLDGEEAVNREWVDPDNCYGSREMAAKLAISGELPKVKAFLLADIVGSHPLRIKRDSYSTKALTDLVWKTAARLGYQEIFVNEQTASEDDHQSFLKRGVPAVDVITDFVATGYWHTPQDTLDKVSANSLAIVGHVFLETVKALQAQQK
jgi:glutaminyl-peptide cyclotransferase